MMQDTEFDYEPNDIDSDEFISELPVSLMKENVKSQFKDPLEYRKRDYIQTFIGMYKTCEENLDAYEETDADTLYAARDEFYEYIQQLLRKYLSIGFNDWELLSRDDQDELIHYVYRFFIINMKKNFTYFIFNYINAHRGEFLPEGDENKGRDVTSLSLKKDVTNPEDVYILANLKDVINDILSKEITVDEFLFLCDSDESCLETRFVTSKYNKFVITGNFVENYIEMLDDEFLFELEVKIRNKILKRYKKKQ